MASGNRPKKLLVAIDIGTTYSGYAFSAYDKNKHNEIHTFPWRNGDTDAPKTLTAVLFDTHKKFHSFGYSALNTYMDLAKRGKHDDWYFFQRVKLELFKEKNLHIKTEIQDATGKPMLAMDVFAAMIQYLSDHFHVHHHDHKDMVDERYIHWVLSVPTIFDNAAKQFMRLAAEKAGITGKRLQLACEAESASLYCHTKDSKCVSMASVGATYMLMNCGGGIVDMTVHQVEHGGKLKEVHPATGGAWGYSVIMEKFFAFLDEIFRCDVRSRLSAFEILQMESQFEDMLHKINEDVIAGKATELCFKMPEELCKYPGIVHTNGYRIRLEDGKLFIDLKTMTELFQPCIESILKCMKTILSDGRCQSVRYVVVVGGFARCKILQSSLKHVFPLVNVIVPTDTRTAVIKGAAMFAKNPHMIKWRIAPQSYGIRKQCRFVHGKHDIRHLEVIDGVEKCTNIFDLYVQKDEHLDDQFVTESKTYCPVRKDQTVMRLRVFSADVRSPEYTNDSGCKKLGQISIQLTDVAKGKNRRIRVKMNFPGTEMKVSAIDEENGKKYVTTIDFLNNV